MNTHGLNAAPINGTISHNTLVNLGAVTVTFVFTPYEHISDHMVGTADMSFSALGDLAKLSQLGSAPFGITFAQTANLTKYANIGESDAGIALDATGALVGLAMLNAVTADVEFSMTANLQRLGALSGTTGIDLAISGDGLFRYKALDPASTGIALDVVGTLMTYAYFPVSEIDIGMNISGAISALRFLSGEADLIFDVSGRLFNNPTADDPPHLTVYRPAVDRVVYRQ